MNQELKRRSRVVRIFSNRESCLRLASAPLKEWREDWITGRRHLRVHPLEVWHRDLRSESEGEMGEKA